MSYLQAGLQFLGGIGLLGAIAWAALRWMYPDFRSAVYIVVVSAATTGAMWVPFSLQPLVDSANARGWDLVLAEVFVAAPYFFVLTLIFTTFLFGPVAAIRYYLPGRFKWISYAVAIPPAVVWLGGFYVYIVFTFAATFDVCLPPGHMEAELGCRLMP